MIGQAGGHLELFVKLLQTVRQASDTAGQAALQEHCRLALTSLIHAFIELSSLVGASWEHQDYQCFAFMKKCHAGKTPGHIQGGKG